MTINQVGIAGTLESSDVMVTMEPNREEGLAIDVSSTVEKQFGREIRRVIGETLETLDIRRAKVTVVDRGALNCAIRARLKTAAYRASGETNDQWGGDQA